MLSRRISVESGDFSILNLIEQEYLGIYIVKFLNTSKPPLKAPSFSR